MEHDIYADDWLANARQAVSRRAFIGGVTAAGAMAGFAIAANPVEGQVIRTPTEGLVTQDGAVKSGDFDVPIYEARPAAPGRYPMVLVIPEAFGMHEHIKDVARRFAHERFLAITFEPYAREGGVLQLPDQQAVMRVANSVPDAQAMGDLDAVFAYGQSHAASSGSTGVTGFCRGGMYTLLDAAHNGKLKAAVPWYGQIKPPKAAGIRTETPLDVASRIKCPILGLYGGADQGIPIADVKEM
jgi:carboxymethylenebutenolidase